ncbi:MFS transporter [Bacillus velezensis]|uniref:MFS transporter n=1 Tax=Bacillus TaxID=1386 RepID=UPI001C533197|nr:MULTISPECIES: MFS transporter [Bacillus amyloliquefaciens group]QXP96533.1 MFS transporter [Bacillus velezensis]UHH02390.1 MFS transporter [Bacillus amyloliquefaciens]ULR22136.1 MFS transporter [Bacillus velezensis]UVW08901.1 MFS transporter [Bacillus velezensis]WHL76216.1 MFS transporter [Bacillus velezensis]
MTRIKKGSDMTYRTPNYAKLWCAQVFSSAADGVWLIALPLLVLELTGSKILVGVISFIELVPLTFGVLAGPLIDLFRKKSILYLCNTGRAAIMILLAVLSANDLLTVWIAGVCAFCLSLQSMLFAPAKVAIIPLLVRKQHLDQATSLINTSDLIGLIVGKLISGIMIAAIPFGMLFALNGTAFLISAAFIAFIRISEQPNEKSNGTEDVKAGYRMLKGNAAWLTSVGYFFVVNLVIAGLISVMGPILAVERFQQNYSVWFAVMYSMFQAGMLLGNLAVFFKWNTKRLNRLYPRTLTAAGLLMMLLFFPLHGFECIIFLVLGIIISYIDVQTVLYFQKTVPAAYFGRVFALIFSIVKMGEPLSAAVYTGLLLLMNADYIFAAVGLTLTIVFAIFSVRQGSQRNTEKQADQSV